MARILIVYESKYGQTEKIAHFIASHLRSRGALVDLLESHKKYIIGLSKYDGVIIGGAVYARGYPHRLQAWAHSHSEILNRKVTAFFSVCLGIMQNDPKVQKDERSIVQSFFLKTGWKPTRWTIFAGALNYTRYSWFTKLIMRQIAKRAGVDTDTRRDYEYTHWNEVTTFADQFYEEARKNDNTSFEFIEGTA